MQFTKEFYKGFAITGSAHKHGMPAMPAENLIKGAVAEAGHDIFR